MSIVSTLSHFSAVHCVSICAVLVPANLLLTIQTLVLTGLGFPPGFAQVSVGLAATSAFALLLHVHCWFAMGVVMAPTYILLTLALTCLSINFLSLAYPVIAVQWLRACRWVLTLVARLSTVRQPG